MKNYDDEFDRYDGDEILDAEVADDGETATVVLKVTYGDGSEEENILKLRKDEEGNWKLDMGK